MTAKLGHGGEVAVMVAGLCASSLVLSCDRESRQLSVQTFRLAEDPVWEVGRSGTEDADMEEHEILHLIAGAKRLADGRVAVALQGFAQVRIYGPDGTHLWSRGQRGEGPGDFQRLKLLETCSGENGIVIYDLALHRVTTLSTQGDLLSTWSVPFEDSPPYNAACAPDGRIVYHSWGGFSNEPGIVRWQVPVSWTAEGSGPHLVRDSVPANERILDAETSSILDRPWSKQLVLGGSDRGVWIGTSDDYVLDLVGWDGSPIITARWSGRDLTVTQEDRDRFRDELIGDLEGQSRENWIRDRWPGWEEWLPSRVPAYARLIANADGVVWVGSWEGEHWVGRLPGHPDARWDEIDSSGMWVRQVTIPVNISPLDFGADWVLVSVRDELGVERLAVYEIMES